MVEPVTCSLTAISLLNAAGGVLGAAADLQGLGAPRALRQLLDRFEAAPEEAPVFCAAVWRAAVRATHGCVQQVHEHTAVTDDVRGDTARWGRFRAAHARVREVREWSDAPTLPQALQDALTHGLAHTLRAQAGAGAPADGDAALTLWNSYCAALRDSGLQEEPPTVIRQAFFGERPETQVWPWSRHFALRIGEQLRNDAGFKAMFDAEQFAWIGTGVARLVAEFTAVEQMLSEMSAKLDAVHETVQTAEKNITQGQDKILAGQQRAHEDLAAKLDRLIASQSNDAALRQEIMQLRLRPDIRLEDLVGWLQAALHRSDPLPPDALPRLLQQALTIDLPKLRAEAERYRLDPLASPEAQALLDEVRALLHPQAGTPLDLQAASDKLKALDDRVVAERTARRREEDHELAQLRVLRAEAERAMAHHAAAAELMEQAAGLCHDDALSRACNEQAAEDWLEDGELHPGAGALKSAIRLLRILNTSVASREESARLHVLLGHAQARLGRRLDGEAGLQALRAAEASVHTALEVHTRADMPVDWAITLNNLGNVQRSLGERLDGEAGLQALRAAEASYHAALAVFTRADMPVDWAITLNNLGNVQSSLGERLDGEAGLQALRAAEGSFHAALEVRTRDDMPVAWAMTHNNLGAVQRSLGERLDGEAGLQALRAAEASFHAALEVRTRDDMPVHWATTRNNLGTVQRSLGERQGGEAGLRALRAAEASFHAALEVRTRTDMPVDWAITHSNLGAVQIRLGERLDGEAGLQALHAAEACLHAALEVCTRADMPVDWAMTHSNLGAVQARLGKRLDGEAGLQALRGAEASFHAALEVRTRADMPVAWAITRNNLGTVQRSLGERLDGEAGLQALRAAEASFHAALEVFTRETMPAYWGIASRNLAVVQQYIAERGG